MTQYRKLAQSNPVLHIQEHLSASQCHPNLETQRKEMPYISYTEHTHTTCASLTHTETQKSPGYPPTHSHGPGLGRWGVVFTTHQHPLDRASETSHIMQWCELLYRVGILSGLPTDHRHCIQPWYILNTIKPGTEDVLWGDSLACCPVAIQVHPIQSEVVNKLHDHSTPS